MMQLSEHFHLSEFVRSQTADAMGWANTPPPEAVRRLHMLCLRVLEPIRKQAGCPILVTSGYRSLKLNRAIGGSDTSSHIDGQAADIYAACMDAAQLKELILRTVPEFDQLYLHRKNNFVHISYRVGNNRNQVLPDKNT
jgi:uncharacterized protein YcbK (DUF882 family)